MTARESGSGAILNLPGGPAPQPGRAPVLAGDVPAPLSQFHWEGARDRGGLGARRVVPISGS